ncbi:hypothetical protein GE061_005099 [Apolygus lucorum]|uniref:Transmembrane protein n=1 Tax=Apolygus lucorum TaxID=248454 RepID=A0A8S9WXX6_APOLU|nr:hypothetical protein GE061_005099 [Apolygus lucorum]
MEGAGDSNEEAFFIPSGSQIDELRRRIDELRHSIDELKQSRRSSSRSAAEVRDGGGRQRPTATEGGRRDSADHNRLRHVSQCRELETVMSVSLKKSKPPLIAKSPSSEKTLLSSADGATYRDSNLLLVVSNLQIVSGLLMLVFGVLCAVYDVTMSRLGAGLWGGMVALLAGSLGTAATLNTCLSRRSSNLYLTLYLALCLVSLAVNTLVLVLTLTAIVRDAQQEIDFVEDSAGQWAGQWCGMGLLAATSLHLLCTLVSVPMSCRRACVAPENKSDLIDTKHHLVSSWLGRHEPPILTPHHLLMEGPPAVYTVPYPHSFTPVHMPTPRHLYRPRAHTPRPPSQMTEATESKRQRRKSQPRQITDEELEKTYTGLDREIAEEFISIAMQPKSTSSRTNSTVSHVVP